MAKLRVSVVEYLNTAPLVWGFTNGPLAGRYDLSFAVPSQCAEQLRRGEVDLGIIPAIEYQRMEGMAVLPGMAVAAKDAVRSILVVSRVPIEQARRVALDASSRSSQALVRMLCAERWRTKPEFVTAPPDPAAMLREADAALLIGDPALRLDVQLAQLAAKPRSGEYCCGGDPSQWPIAGMESIYLYDVAHEWRALTGLPCVLAIWVGRRDAISPQVVADFAGSKEYGVARIGEIAEAAAEKLELPATELESYLRENIDFGLDAENRAGLELYFRKARQLGLIAEARAVEYASAPAAAKGM
jgi:predicted solute-binding protein